MLPITNIVIEEEINDVRDIIFTFKCKGCGDIGEAHIDSNGNVLIHKLCECGLINLHKDFLGN